MKFLNKMSKLLAKDIETLSQRYKMEVTLSPSHDMAEYVNNYWKWRSCLGNKTLVEK